MADDLQWNLPLRVLLSNLAVTADGLSAAEAERRLAETGPNDALARRKSSLLHQILIASAAGLTGDWAHTRRALSFFRLFFTQARRTALTSFP
jgi:hypothetical protein